MQELPYTSGLLIQFFFSATWLDRLPPIGMPAVKVLADEEMARRLHEELNGPEVSPAAAALKRSRKPPTFYSPPVSPFLLTAVPQGEACAFRMES